MKRKSTYILADATIGKQTVLNRNKNEVTLLLFLVSSLNLEAKIARFLQPHFKSSAS